MLILGVALTANAHAGVIDRIAVVVGKRVIKDSDIVRDIRINSFLNRQPLNFDLPTRRKAASRLIDQELIRAQIRSGSYAIAKSGEADAVLASLKKDRFPQSGSYERALQAYRITEDQLHERLAWQLTVLRFIDARFRPAAIVSEDETSAYYERHQAELKRAFPKANGLEDLRAHIDDQLSAEKVNMLLDEWLAEQRKDAELEYLEPELK